LVEKLRRKVTELRAPFTPTDSCWLDCQRRGNKQKVSKGGPLKGPPLHSSKAGWQWLSVRFCHFKVS